MVCLIIQSCLSSHKLGFYSIGASFPSFALLLARMCSVSKALWLGLHLDHGPLRIGHATKMARTAVLTDGGVETQYYVDPSTDVQAIKRRLRGA